MADGLAPDMPVAVIENAAARNAGAARAAGRPARSGGARRVKSPALIVIGEVTAEPISNNARLALEAAQ
jgi:uroporphyrin-III C-methyltransferase